MSPRIGIDAQLHSFLRASSVSEGRPMVKIVADAFERYQKAEFWKRAGEDYARLRAEPEEWPSYQADIALLEGGSMDGLTELEPYYSPEEIDQVNGR